MNTLWLRDTFPGPVGVSNCSQTGYRSDGCLAGAGCLLAAVALCRQEGVAGWNLKGWQRSSLYAFIEHCWLATALFGTFLTCLPINQKANSGGPEPWLHIKVRRENVQCVRAPRSSQTSLSETSGEASVLYINSLEDVHGLLRARTSSLHSHTCVHTQAHVETSSVVYPDDTRALNCPHSFIFFFTHLFM